MDLTPEQELLAESVRRTCARHSGLDVVRKFENDPVGYPPSLWQQLGELGILGMTIGEDFGGTGMSMLDAAIVYAELGRALAPSPHLVSCVLAAGVLERAAGPAIRQEWLPPLAAGDAVATVAWLEPGGGFGARGIGSTLTKTNGAWRLDGTKRHVPYARAADVLVVLATTPDGPALALVDPSADGVGLEQQLTVAGDAQYAATFGDVAVDDAHVVTGDVWAAWNDTMLDVVTLVAAQAAGGARAALDLTVDYSKKREQFDRPLGGFQAISHYLADATTAVDGAETLVWEAAWTRSVGRPVDRLAPMAKLFACRTFRDVTAMAQQVFGGNGFTVEFDIQLYFRRAKSLQLNWWDERHLEELIAETVLAS